MAAILPPGTLGVGIQLPIQSQSTRYAQPWEEGSAPDDLAAIARHCDEAGFLYVAVCDHVAIPRPHDEVMGTEWWDTIATLGWLAGITSRVRLLSHVYVLPYRHPLMAAKAFSTLDVVSGGRVVVGVGAGHVEDEFGLLGVPFDQRGRMLDEGIDVLRAAFADEYPDSAGGRWPVRDAGQRPRPVQPGGPPIWVGGSSPAAIRRAATRGDGWLPQGSPQGGMRAGIARLLELRREALGDDVPIDIGLLAETIYVGDPWFDPQPGTLTGDGAAIAERLVRYRALGVRQIQIRFQVRSVAEYCDQVDAFGDQVLPQLAA